MRTIKDKLAADLDNGVLQVLDILVRERSRRLLVGHLESWARGKNEEDGAKKCKHSESS